MSDIDKRVYRFSGSKFVTLGYHVQRIKQLEDAMKYIKLCADRVLAKCEKMDNPDMWVIQQEAEKALEK